MREHDFQWLVEHGPELYRDYAGKWIAVREGEIIAVGQTATETAQVAREKAKDDDFILEAVDPEPDAIYGCV